MKDARIDIGEGQGAYGKAIMSLCDYPGSTHMVGKAMLTVHIQNATATVHGVTPSQLREMAAAFNAMADVLQTVNLETV